MASASKTQERGADDSAAPCTADQIEDPLVLVALVVRALDIHTLGRHCFTTGGVAKNVKALSVVAATSTYTHSPLLSTTETYHALNQESVIVCLV